MRNSCISLSSLMFFLIHLPFRSLLLIVTLLFFCSSTSCALFSWGSFYWNTLLSYWPSIAFDLWLWRTIWIIKRGFRITKRLRRGYVLSMKWISKYCISSLLRFVNVVVSSYRCYYYKMSERLSTIYTQFVVSVYRLTYCSLPMFSV